MARSPHAPAALTPVLISCLLLANGRLSPAEEITTNRAPVVWAVTNVNQIGGRQPQVLGNPGLLDAAAGGPALRFDGKGDGLIVPLNPLAGLKQFTIEVLLNPEANGPTAQRFFHIEDDRGSRALLEIRILKGNFWSLDAFLQSGSSKRTLYNRDRLHPTGAWTWVALVYDGRRMTDYVNGTKEEQGTVTFPPMSKGQTSLGVRLNKVFWFAGSLKEVRFHSRAIPPGELQREP